MHDYVLRHLRVFAPGVGVIVALVAWAAWGFQLDAATLIVVAVIGVAAALGAYNGILNAPRRN